MLCPLLVLGMESTGQKIGGAGHLGTFDVLLSVDQGMETGQENPAPVQSAGPGGFVGVGLRSVLCTRLEAAVLVLSQMQGCSLLPLLGEVFSLLP